MKRAVRSITAAAAGLAAAVLLAAPANAVPAPEKKALALPEAGDVLVLPKPTGSHPVGREVLHLVDQSRMDPWVPTGPRELMVSVWYPAAAERGKRVPYATAEESRLMLESVGVIGVPSDILTRVRPHARAGAPPLRSDRRLPLVVVSPGFSDPRWMLTTLAEDLASRGYVVVGVDHTYEGSGVTFPDGRVTGCLLCEREHRDGKEIVANRARDNSFVLDRLLAHATYGRMIDHDRIGVVGHSMGGAAAAGTMLTDRRVDAGVNLDGGFQQALDRDLDRPFLMLSAHFDPNVHIDWNAAWDHLTGWRQWLDVPLMEHRSYSDAPFVGEWLGVTGWALPGARSVEITRTYVAAFFDRHLRNRHSPLLKWPSPWFPEVRFMGPTAE
ncbi:alpha/beta hydrolase family protein [Nonomuraea sp. NPDC049480]|uniref:alpha/beta hydrolase family protein n=1 Tax=Nonomuraea sp. NPDC049480 TaxID=3364353 RepID=UPI0037A1EDCD